MQPFNKKAPTEAEAFSLRLVPLASCPAIFSPIPLFAILQGFEQVIIRAGLEFLHLVVNPVHDARFKYADLFQFKQVAGRAGERRIQASEQVVSVGLLGWFKIVHSHCISSCGALVRGGSALTRWPVPLLLYSRKPEPKICQIQIRTLPEFAWFLRCEYGPWASAPLPSNA